MSPKIWQARTRISKIIGDCSQCREPWGDLGKWEMSGDRPCVGSGPNLSDDMKSFTAKAGNTFRADSKLLSDFCETDFVTQSPNSCSHIRIGELFNHCRHEFRSIA